MKKKSQPLFSIVIPVYNSEKYITEALASILAQGFFDYEVIIVDDGSSDNSLSIIKEIVSQDARFHVISQNNSGVSSARNRGLSLAKGMYVIFLDSDDRLDLCALTKLSEVIDKKFPDIIICDYFQWFPEKKQALKAASLNECSVVNYSEFLKIVFSIADFPDRFPCGGYVCNKCFKRSFICKTTFEEFTSAAEDEYFCLKVAKLDMRVFYFPIQLFYYRQHEDSQVHQTDFAFRHLVTRKNMLLENIKKSGNREVRLILATAFTQTLISCFASILLNSSLCSQNRLLWLKQQSCFILRINSHLDWIWIEDNLPVFYKKWRFFLYISQTPDCVLKFLTYIIQTISFSKIWVVYKKMRNLF